MVRTPAFSLPRARVQSLVGNSKKKNEVAEYQSTSGSGTLNILLYNSLSHPERPLCPH